MNEYLSAMKDHKRNDLGEIIGLDNFEYPLNDDIYEIIAQHDGKERNYPKLNDIPGVWYDSMPIGERERQLDYVLAIKSTPKDMEFRKTIRETYANKSCSVGMNLTHAFILGLDEDENLMAKVRQECNMHEDIILLNHREDYFRSTYKVFATMKYTHEKYKRAKILVMIDQDYFIHPRNLADYIRTLMSGDMDSLISGYVISTSKPMREKHAKWQVSIDEYPYDKYPVYIGGGHIVLSMRMADKLAKAFQYTKYLKIDDVLIGIILLKMNIIPKSGQFFSYNENTLKLLPPHRIISHHCSGDVELMKKLWAFYQRDELCYREKNSTTQ